MDISDGGDDADDKYHPNPLEVVILWILYLMWLSFSKLRLLLFPVKAPAILAGRHNLLQMREDINQLPVLLVGLLTKHFSRSVDFHFQANNKLALREFNVNNKYYWVIYRFGGSRWRIVLKRWKKIGLNERELEEVFEHDLNQKIFCDDGDIQEVYQCLQGLVDGLVHWEPYLKPYLDQYVAASKQKLAW